MLRSLVALPCESQLATATSSILTTRHSPPSLLRRYYPQLTDVLSELGVSPAAIKLALTPGDTRAARNVAQTEKGRELCGGSVPKFIVKCAGDASGADLTAAGSPTSPEYFENVFEACERRIAAQGTAALAVPREEL
jgi:hypothetical protein